MNLRPLIFAAAVLVLSGAFDLAPAQASNKIALMLGNDAYSELPSLERAVADARAYRELLENQRGFEVIYAENAGRATVFATISRFLPRVRDDDVAMVIYSGHGVQLDPDRRDTLYLLPSDTPLPDPGAGGGSSSWTRTR